jgi:hypothetical protein
VCWGPALALVAAAVAAGAVALVQVRAHSRAADERAAVLQLDALCMALALHRQAVGRYPSASEGLRELWGLAPETLRDPWGDPVEYRVASDRQSFVLRARSAELASSDCPPAPVADPGRR